MLGRLRDGTCGLARGQVVCRESWLSGSPSTRFEALVRKALPLCRRRVGANSVFARTCFCANHRALSRLQAANSRSSQRSHRYRTIAATCPKGTCRRQPVNLVCRHYAVSHGCLGAFAGRDLGAAAGYLLVARDSLATAAAADHVYSCGRAAPQHRSSRAAARY